MTGCGGLPKAWARVLSAKGLEQATQIARWRDAARAPACLCEHGGGLGLDGADDWRLLGNAAHGVTRGYIHKVDATLVAAADKLSRAIWHAMTGEAGVVVPLNVEAR
jgi:hypothetical protein